MINIYKITNLVNSKLYIGMTSQTIEKRLLGHYRHSKTPKFRLHQAIKKHGKENFIIEKLDTVTTMEEANILEKYWIEKLKSTNYNFGYNMALGGSGKSIMLDESIKQKIKNSVQAHRDSLSIEEKLNLTKSANIAKTGMKESVVSRKLKSDAQSKRWENSTEEQRKEHGQKSRNNTSEEGKSKSLNALISAYSPSREPGVKKKQVTCPHCNKIGGNPIMKRYHFDNCKENKN